MTANQTEAGVHPSASPVSEEDLRAILDAMDLVAPPDAAWEIPTAALRQAQRFWAANSSALAVSQPVLAAAMGSLPALQWIYGRDGALTARNAGNRWLAGCSLPHRAAQTLLRHLDTQGSVACYLAPVHAAQIRVALDKMRSSQALLVLQPEGEIFRQYLACCDFSTDIKSHRLWFAAGKDWEAEAHFIFSQNQGLATPAQFIRVPTTAEELCAAMMPPAERIFAETQRVRADRIAAIQNTETGRSQPMPSGPPTRAVLLVAPSSFHLWAGAADALVQALGQSSEALACHRFDLDDPLCSSGLALAEAAAERNAIVAADLGRTDLPQVLRSDTAVLTWVTTPRMPAFNAEHDRDGLLLADASWQEDARRAGWPKDRVTIARWPEMPVNTAAGTASSAAGNTPRYLALIADTRSIATPVKEMAHSSHHVLWERIAGELLNNPLTIGGDPRGYLDRHRAEAGVSDAAFNWELFAERLLLPAYSQGLANLLLKAGLPLRIYGQGWETMESAPGIQAAWAGPLTSREEFHRAIESARVLVHPWPMTHATAIEAMGRPVLRPARGKQATSASAYLREAAELMRRPITAFPPVREALTAEKVLSLLRI